MTPRDHDSLAWSLDYCARRLSGALERAAPYGTLGSHVLRGVWAATCRELNYLEMLVRRLLIFMAGQLSLPPPSAVKREPVRPKSAATLKRPKTLGKASPFSVFDPLLNHNEILRRYGADAVTAKSGLSLINLRHARQPVVSAARIAARFEAIARVLADPEPYARRVARFMQRRRARLCSGRAIPIRLGLPPSLARGSDGSLERSAYFEGERLAMLVLNAGWDPPSETPILETNSAKKNRPIDDKTLC